MSGAFAPAPIRTALAPDDRDGLSDRTVRVGTSTFGARLATAAAGTLLPATPALVVFPGGLLLVAGCRALDPSFLIA